MLTVTTVTLLLVMALALSRAFVGPTVFDRILAANMFGTKTVLLIAVIGFLFGRPELLDIAMVYALINFIGVIGMLRLIEYLEDENRSSQEEDA